MSVTKTLGGDRIGAGKKMQVEMDGYVRSNFDLSRVWRSTATCGTIIPCFTEIGQKGDTWFFDLASIVRTKPTNGPLYGSFKIELLFFAADIRLYNGALHNNALNLGLEMKNVVYPKIEIPIAITKETDTSWDIQKKSMNPSALMAYLGVTNPGSTRFTGVGSYATRFFNGMFPLMYWDVVKNYFLNKQEPNAYYIGVDVVGGGSTTYWNKMISATVKRTGQTSGSTALIIEDYGALQDGMAAVNNNGTITLAADATEPGPGTITIVYGINPSLYDPSLMQVSIKEVQTGAEHTVPLSYIAEESEPENVDGNTKVVYTMSLAVMEANNGNDGFQLSWFKNLNGTTQVILNYIITQSKTGSSTGVPQGMQLKSFPIENLDKARGVVLKNFFEGENVRIVPSTRSLPTNSIINFPPYSELTEVVTEDGIMVPKNKFSQHGLALKTYQNDIFNSFLNTDTIAKINSETGASITNGVLSISNLILAEKIYKLKNRIAVAGGTYEDWQEAVYGISTAPANESPRFIGGASSEIVFDEVVSSSATESDPLGTLGGRGNLSGWKGGKFELEVKEDCLIMGVVCITPRVDYSQGNKWFMSLQNNDQLHKPELDRIGFQDLIGDWMNGADTVAGVQTDWGTTKSYAMQPAWIHYMTAVNEAHGDFADPDKEMFMTLNRQYEVEANNGSMQIKDFTSYIDPTKYNYAFADTTIESQNFWVQLGIDAKVRRVMSQKVMPNL